MSARFATFSQIGDQVFASAVPGCDLAVGDRGTKPIWIRIGDGFGEEDFGFVDRLVEGAIVESSADGFDFGEFWHGICGGFHSKTPTSMKKPGFLIKSLGT